MSCGEKWVRKDRHKEEERGGGGQVGRKGKMLTPVAKWQIPAWKR